MDPSRSAGFTLVEVLVALLVLAVVMAGSMAAQLSALRARQGSALMSSAAALASEVADRMRANPRERAHYLALDYDAARDGPPRPAGGQCYGVAGCDGSALARADLDDIRQAVHDRFPGGRIVICRDADIGQGSPAGWGCSGAASSPVAVKIGWVHRGSGADGAATLAVTMAVPFGAS